MQSKSRITVVSEGRLFHGVRTPLAFTWTEVSATSVGAPVRKHPRAPVSNLVYVFSQLEKLKLAKQDLALRREQKRPYPPANSSSWL
jgi:hypothetical protein